MGSLVKFQKRKSCLRAVHIAGHYERRNGGYEKESVSRGGYVGVIVLILLSRLVLNCLIIFLFVIL